MVNRSSPNHQDPIDLALRAVADNLLDAKFNGATVPTNLSAMLHQLRVLASSGVWAIENAAVATATDLCRHIPEGLDRETLLELTAGNRGQISLHDLVAGLSALAKEEGRDTLFRFATGVALWFDQFEPLCLGS